LPSHERRQLLLKCRWSWSEVGMALWSRVPFSVTIDASGSLVAKLASQPDVQIGRARFGNKVVRWTMPGSLGVDGEPFTLALKLYLRDGSLVGDAETSPAPGNANGFRTYYWVQLKSE